MKCNPDSGCQMSDISHLLHSFLSFPDGSGGKESTCNEGDASSIPGLGRSSGGGNGNLLQYSCLKQSHGQKSLVGYSPKGGKESDTRGLSTHVALSTPVCGFHPHTWYFTSLDGLFTTCSLGLREKRKGQGEGRGQTQIPSMLSVHLIGSSTLHNHAQLQGRLGSPPSNTIRISMKKVKRILAEQPTVSATLGVTLSKLFHFPWHQKLYL